MKTKKENPMKKMMFIVYDEEEGRSQAILKAMAYTAPAVKKQWKILTQKLMSLSVSAG